MTEGGGKATKVKVTLLYWRVTPVVANFGILAETIARHYNPSHLIKYMPFSSKLLSRAYLRVRLESSVIEQNGRTKNGNGIKAK
jgi:hypothetical protein